LLSVTDGAGHQTKINYNDANELGPVYKKFLPSGDCRWPQRCVARTDHALVSDHTDAHFESQSRLVAQVDRVTSYQYEGARLDTAGYGWLGFGRRTILIEDGAQDFLGSTTIDYEDPEPWVLGTSTAPYKYLRAGLQHSRREVAPSAYSPISSSTNHHAETFRTFEYTERTSVSGRPFIFLSRTEVNTSDLLSDTNDAVQLVQEVGTTDLDAYGNATDETTTRTDYAYSLGIASLVPSSAAVDHRSSTFTPTAAEVASWLISLPKTVTISSTPRCISSSDCAARTQERTTSITYYPDTGLSQVVTRDSTDPSLSLTTEVIRDDRGNVTQVTSTDVNGDTRIGRTTFDTRHLFPVTTAAVADASEHVTQVRFDDRFGSLASMADPNGIDETWSYDEFGVMRAHSGPGGSETTDYQESDYQELADGFEIPASLKVTTNKLGGARLETEINSFGQVVRRKSFGFNGENVFEELGYDSRQRLTIQRRPHLAGDASQGQVQYGYDELDRLITEDYPDGAHVAHDYASAASLVTSLSGWRIGGAQTFVQATDPRGNKTLSIYDRDNQLIGVVDAKNDLTSYEYAAFGQLERIVDPFERMIDFVHDPYGRLRSVTDDARGGTESTSYNAFDQPVFTSDAAGRVRQMHYDGFGRIESLDDNDGTSTWVYDRSDENENDTHDNEIGRPVEVTSSSGQRQILHYEPRQANSNRGLLDQSTSELYPLDAPVGAAPRRLTTHYHYDGYSRLEQIDYPTSSGVPLSVKYSFDGYGHTLSAFNAENTSQVYWRLISADQGYRIKEERLGTHTCGTSQGTATTRTYEALSGRQHTIKTQCGSQLLQDLTYAYDPSGNLSSRVDARTDLTENFDHDELNRLTGYSTGEGVPVASRYSYESNSLEQRRMTWQADVGEYVYETAKGRDWIYSAGQTIYEHDAVGNIISRTRQDVAGDSQSIEYTAFDLPSKVTAPGTEVDFAYDASGSRVVKQGPSSTTFYGGDGYQRTETGAAINQRFTIYAGGRAIAQISNTDTGGTVSPATVNYLHDDHLGSVNVISDAAGALTTTRTYTPFGKDSSPPTVSPFGFTGQEADDDLGLINMRGRMYDPTLGQFLSADPIMQQPYGQGLNRFAYVNNSPLNFTDPSGFAAKRTSKAYGGDGQTEGILAGFGMYFVAGISSQLGAGAQAFSVGAAAGAVAPAAEVAGGSAATEAGVEAGAAYGPGAGVASIASVGVSIAIDDMLGTWQPTGASSAEPARSGGGRTGGAVGRGAAAPDALAPVQERGGRPSLFDRARGALAANDSDSDSAVKNPFLKFEHKLDSSFKPVGPVELGDFSPGKAPDMGSPPRRTLDPPGPDEVTSVWDHNIKQKYLDELSKLDPSPGKYLLEQNKPLLKAQGSRLLSQINENPINWVPIALVGGGLATIGVVAAVNCGRDGVDCSFK
jgi:RHS repeat-associated protein